MKLWAETFTCPNCSAATSIYGGVCCGCDERLGRNLLGMIAIGLWLAFVIGGIHFLLRDAATLNPIAIGASLAWVTLGAAILNMICRLSWTWKILK